MSPDEYPCQPEETATLPGALPTLETDRLVLREPREEDAPDLLAIHRDVEAMQYYGMGIFSTIDQARLEIDALRALFRESGGLRWVITAAPQTDFIGDIGFHNVSSRHARAEIGYKLSRRLWRQGIMSEALCQVLRYGFEKMGLNRIEAVVGPRNTASLALLTKAGFTQEGVLREYEAERDGFVDLAMASLLRREWSA